MLRRIVFLLKEDKKAVKQLFESIENTAEYIRECGYEAVIGSENSYEMIDEYTLFLTDSGDIASDMADNGGYCAGILHDGNKGEDFKGLKYVFSDIEEVDIDSFVKVYQRYAGEPWTLIRTERLIIRETTLDDVDEFYRIYKDPEMTRYMEGLFDNPEDEKRYQKDYIEKVYGLMGFGVWTLVRASDGEVIGRAGYSVRNGFDEIELGFLVGRDYQGQGYAYEACNAILEYGQKVLLFDNVQALVKKENEVSVNLCKKLGFVLDDEVEVEEDIYGHGYTGSDRVELSEAKYGTYLRFRKALK